MSTHCQGQYQARLQERLRAQPESIAPLRHALVTYAREHGATELQQDDIALAVSEAVSNAVLHAYVGREPGDVGIDASVADRLLQVIVWDEGSGMRPRPDSPGMRLGLSLIGRVSERFELESARATPGTRVSMAIAIG